MTHTRERRRALLVTLVALAAPLLFSCWSEPDSPEARVRALLDRAEVAAEDKDLGTLREMVSESYADGRQDKQGVMRLLTYYFFRNRSIHLLTRVQRVAFPEPERAEVTVFVAMAGRPIPDPAGLARVRADLYRFDFAIVDEGKDDWKVTRAEWRRAETSDFL